MSFFVPQNNENLISFGWTGVQAFSDFRMAQSLSDDRIKHLQSLANLINLHDFVIIYF
jgi:hypothetical protein